MTHGANQRRDGLGPKQPGRKPVATTLPLSVEYPPCGFTRLILDQPCFHEDIVSKPSDLVRGPAWNWILTNEIGLLRPPHPSPSSLVVLLKPVLEMTRRRTRDLVMLNHVTTSHTYLYRLKPSTFTLQSTMSVLGCVHLNLFKHTRNSSPR